MISESKLISNASYDPDFVLYFILGKPDDKEAGLRRGRGDGTMQEWMERADLSQFFTMDYSQVRRRRPIHNKSLPVGP